MVPRRLKLDLQAASSEGGARNRHVDFENLTRQTVMYYNAWIPDDLREIITHQSKNIWTRNALGYMQTVLLGMI